MVHLPSDITESEMILANGGKPLEWPNDPLQRIAYVLWLRSNLQTFVEQERMDQALLIGSHGNQDTAHKVHTALRTLAKINGYHIHHGWPTGLEGIIKLIKTDPQDWPATPQKYGLI
ncbi:MULTISPECIES: hypothetical protein [unclassified Ruegeria]|uniref:hypothetical protein n=2 Tax=unclassified Ruegeria TaxID=2625375 RepID=UPI00148935C0|nr:MULTISPECIES: hypothetical protein [unclassified Ruegeria]NOD75992.1 hypothetical protein [Ruegeria sp. HKCCD4332]NOD92446.1 hypothetical protein [Ruegeria sp. HKCCD4884]